MEFTKNQSGDSCVVNMNGKFTASDSTEFRNIISIFSDKETNKVILDISNINFVDSAALGMFLIAREQSEKANVKLKIKSPSEQPAKAFRISKFDTLFDII